MSPTAKSVVDAEEVKVNTMGVFLVVEPLVRGEPLAVAVMVMLGGGVARSTLVPPKNILL